MELKKAWNIFKEDYMKETGRKAKFYMTAAQIKNRTATAYIGRSDFITEQDIEAFLRTFAESKAIKKFEENAGVKVMLRHVTATEGGYTFHYIRFNY